MDIIEERKDEVSSQNVTPSRAEYEPVQTLSANVWGDSVLSFGHDVPIDNFQGFSEDVDRAPAVTEISEDANLNQIKTYLEKNNLTPFKDALDKMRREIRI